MVLLVGFDFQHFVPFAPFPLRTYQRPFHDVDLQEFWYFCVLKRKPFLNDALEIGRTYFSNAAETESEPSLKELSYDFHGAGSWGYKFYMLQGGGLIVPVRIARM